MAEPLPPVVSNAQQKLSIINPSPDSGGGEAVARLLVDQGLVTETQLGYARRVKTKLVSDRSLIEIFQELSLLTNRQLNQALKKQPLCIRTGTSDVGSPMMARAGRVSRSFSDAIKCPAPMQPVSSSWVKAKCTGRSLTRFA